MSENNSLNNDKIRYLSVCSGIEAATVAWELLGWQAVAFSEIEAFPCAVLKYHYPDVPNLGDMTRIDGSAYKGKVDLVVGGTPCQAFSLAGKRESLNDDRGNLTLKFVELCNDIEPNIIVWENVPGVLSTKDNAFGCFLAGLAGEDEPLQPPGGKWTHAGYVLGPERAIAWRVLDAQYFGLAQRRRRVFVVASPRDGIDPREVLFEREGVRRDSAPSRSSGQNVAGLTAKGTGTCGADDNQAQADPLRRGDVTCVTGEVTHTLTTRCGGRNAGEDGTGHGTPIVAFGVSLRGLEGGATAEITGEVSSALKCAGGDDKSHVLALTGLQPDNGCYEDISPTLKMGSGESSGTPPGVAMQGIAYTTKLHNTASNNAGKIFEERTTCLDASSPPPALLTAARCRRLTPTECERLQGFPDRYTLIPYGGKNKLAADGNRYKALGNSMAVPCMAFIGRRISEVLKRYNAAKSAA